MKPRHLLEGCGAAILVLLAYLWSQLSPDRFAIYLSVLPVSTVTGGILLDLLALSLIFAIVIMLISLRNSDDQAIAWALVIAVIVTATVGAAAKVADVQRFVPKPGLLAAITLAAVLALRYFCQRIYGKVVGGFRVVLAIVGFAIIWMAPKLLRDALHRQTPDVMSFRNVISVSRLGNRDARVHRIIWLLFDELSYAQTFESDIPGLALPNFHRLRDERASLSLISRRRVTTPRELFPH